ncbi:RNA-guided endonuclease InsQ/TnpB family protein [Hydrogenophaga bisanensis]|uniref:RNA-guided endonuclease InsQ/TnpB family protein n=1 Tax=Hydrogenophaga bisanensis TaxID=439611 RepID=A0ABW2RDU8_9BURK
MTSVRRKATFRLYPNAAQEVALGRTLVAHCKLYNTLLETARLRYKAGLPAFTRTSVNEATRLVRNTQDWIAQRTTAQSVQVTGERLVRAFDAFFRRLAAGQTPGYPRFKSIERYPGWGYKAHGDGWTLLRKGAGFGAVRLSAVGTVSLRGRARFEGVPKTAEVFRQGHKWYLSVTFEVAETAVARQGGQQSMAFDFGLTTLLTQVVGDPMAGEVQTVENPRWLKRKLQAIQETQRIISALESKVPKNAKPSCALLMAYVRRRRLHSQVARQRNDFYHQLSARLVARFGLIVTEELALTNLVRAPKARPNEGAAADEPQYLPNGAAAKAGLNRSLLDAAPGGFLQKLRYKAEEAGSKFIEIPTRAVKPTQRCHCCGAASPKRLDERRWRCACGAEHERDENAARTMLRYAYEGVWWDKLGSGTGPVAQGATRNFHPSASLGGVVHSKP